MKNKGIILNKFTNRERSNKQMKLIEEILREDNLQEAIRRVKANRGVAGVDKMTVA